MSTKRLTVEDINQRLINTNRSITLLSYGKNTHDVESKWKCHICNHEWRTSAHAILTTGSGCHSCTSSVRLTQEMISQRLIDNDRPITLLYYGNNTKDNKSRWKCTICGYEWCASANVILSNRGCSSCAGLVRLTQEMISQRLIDNDRPITLLSYSNNGKDNKSRWKCDKCGNEWTASANNVLNNDSGCPPCSSWSLNQEIIAQRLIDNDRPITLLSYTGNLTNNKSLWKCHYCDHEWKTAATNILNKGSGCPSCAEHGFDYGKTGYVYLHTFNGFIKIGITNYPKDRYRDLNNQTIDGTLYTIESTLSCKFKNGGDAIDLEATILKKFKQHAYTKLLETTFDGKTELFEHSAHQKILDYITENYDITWV